jgi:digeranylgeranylglycerophospholipid reductase
MTSKYDVLVIGGGPVGSRTASQLAGKGFQVAVLEKRTSFLPSICCTGLISRECLEHFAIDSGLIKREYQSADVFSPGGQTLSLHRPDVQAYVVDRPGLDQYFMNQAVRSGADCCLGYEVTALKVNTNGVTAEVENGGEKKVLESSIAVLAPGFKSRLLAQVGFKAGSDWVMGIQAVVGTQGVTGIEIYTGRRFAPGFFAWLVPVGANMALAGLMARRETRKHFDYFLDYLKAQGKVLHSEAPLLRGITLSQPSRTYNERVIVVGDAAGQVKPLTGGGLYYGLRCADIAADCLAYALSRNASGAASLAVYEKAWHELLKTELRKSRLARRAFGMISDNHLDCIFGYVARHHLAEKVAASNNISFDWHGRAIGQAIRSLIPFSLREEHA